MQLAELPDLVENLAAVGDTRFMLASSRRLGLRSLPRSRLDGPRGNMLAARRLALRGLGVAANALLLLSASCAQRLPCSCKA
jgi:hypothetical protein